MMNKTKQTVKKGNDNDKLNASKNKSISVNSSIPQSQENFSESSKGQNEVKSSCSNKKQMNSQKCYNVAKGQSVANSKGNSQKQKNQNDNKKLLKKPSQKSMLYSEAQMIKVGGVDNKEGNKQVAFLKNSEMKNESNNKHEAIIEQIQNEIRLNNLQSKVIQYHSVNPNLVRQIQKLASSESQVVQSPIINKQSEIFINLNMSHQKKTENGSKLQIGLIKIQNIDKDIIKQEKSVLDLNSEEEKEINQSIEKQIGHYPKMQSKKQKQLKIVKAQSQFEYEVEEGSKQHYNKANNVGEEIDGELKISNKDNHLIKKTGNPTVADNSQISGRQVQLQTLRQAVKELRLQNFKIKSQKQSWLSNLQQNFKKIRPQSFGGSNQIAQPSNRQRNKSSSQPGKPRLFGRISRNISAVKRKSYDAQGNLQLKANSTSKVLSFHHLQDQGSNDKETAGYHVRRYLQEQKQRKKGSEYMKEYNTMELTKVENENQFKIDHSKEIPQQISLQINQILNQNKINIRGNQICQKLLDKFQSNHKKFRKFMTRQQIKSKQKMQKLLQQNTNKTANPQILKKGQSLILQEFQGTIIKNIPKPIQEANNTPIFLKNGDADYINVKTLALIVQAEKKVLSKKKVKFSKIIVPKFPEPPSHDISIQEMMKLIKQVLLISKAVDFPQDFVGCSLKKYKNCIMFELPNNNRFRIVWHFKGKLYIGQWSQQSNEKSGYGIEFVKDGYFYRGEFSSGKKYGQGLLVYANGSIYEGEFINGQRYGKGKYFDSQDNSYYMGEWKNNKMEGLGYFQFDDNVYQGNFKLSLKHGFGVEQFHNGDKYMGEYVKDCFQGDGKYVWADGSVYIGQFKQNSRDGLGKWMSSQQNGQTYTGFYTKDKKHGSGKYIWSNGCMYEGNFDNDLKHGIGNLQYPDGRCAEGIWVQGILTEVISKLSETHLDEPLTLRKRKAPKRRTSKRKVPVEDGLD